MHTPRTGTSFVAGRTPNPQYMHDISMMYADDICMINA